jgi:hypothetical protein
VKVWVERRQREQRFGVVLFAPAGYAARREGWIDAKGTREAVIPALTAAVVGFMAVWPIWQRTNGMMGAIGSATVFVSVYIFALRVLFSLRLDELVSILPKSGQVRRMLLLTPNAQGPVHD